MLREFAKASGAEIWTRVRRRYLTSFAGLHFENEPGLTAKVGEIEVWGCMRVCVNRNRGRYCFLFCKGPILNDIQGHSDHKNICHITGNRI